MRRFLRVKKASVIPQIMSIHDGGRLYTPNFWHATIDQDRPVGSKMTFTEHIHDLYHVVLYTRGQGFYRLQGRYLPASAGTCVLVCPGQKHDFVSRRQTAVYSELTFSYEIENGDPLRKSYDDMLSSYTGFDFKLQETIKLPPESTQVLSNLLIRMTDYLNSSLDMSTYYAHRTLANIFNFLIENGAHHQRLHHIDDRFVRAKMWIEEHYPEKLDLEKMASEAGVSKGHFFREFKKNIGLPPLAYQQKLRLEAAKTLLKATSLQCNEIAARVGFADVYFFHRMFKKHIGVTALQYRKKGM